MKWFTPNFGGENLRCAKDFALFPRAMFYVEHLPMAYLSDLRRQNHYFPLNCNAYRATARATFEKSECSGNNALPTT